MTDELQRTRPRLLSLAYRLLGTWADAEDAVQDTHVRWLAQADRTSVESPRSWMERVLTHRCIDVLRSARARRETYVGPWLPEPVATDDRGALKRAEVDVDHLSL